MLFVPFHSIPYRTLLLYLPYTLLHFIFGHICCTYASLLAGKKTHPLNAVETLSVNALNCTLSYSTALKYLSIGLNIYHSLYEDLRTNLCTYVLLVLILLELIKIMYFLFVVVSHLSTLFPYNSAMDKET